MDPVLVRRVVGTATVVLIIGLGAVGLDARFNPDDVTEIQAELGDAGVGLRSDSDVKLRGVKVGRVAGVTIDESGEATARLQLEQDVPDDVRPVVTPKSFLGEKQVELRTDRQVAAPFLGEGAAIAAREEDQPIEPVDVVDDAGQLLRDVDGPALASMVSALAQFDLDDADVLGEGIDSGAELAAFLDRTAPQQIARLGDGGRALDAVADAGDELTRVADALPGGAAPLTRNREQLVATLDEVSELAAVMDRFLTIEEETLGRALAVGDRIGRVLDPRLGEIGDMVHGVYRYSLAFGQVGSTLQDGTEHANFRVFVGAEGQMNVLCEQLPDQLAEVAPGCVTRDDDDASPGERARLPGLEQLTSAIEAGADGPDGQGAP